MPMRIREIICEMPEGTIDLNSDVTMSELDKLISAVKNNPIVLDSGLKKVDDGSVVYYWYEQNHEKIMAVMVEKHPPYMVIKLSGKRYRNIPPYASDMYLAISKDLPDNIKLMGDKKLSKSAFKTWKRLINTGHSISVYDGNTIHPITSEDDMMLYYRSNNLKYQKFQFILDK